MNRTKVVLIVSVIALLFLTPLTASADLVGALFVPNAALSPFPPDYASVVIHLVSATEATVTYTALTHDGFTYLLGGNAAADFNVNASSFTATATGTCAFTSCGPLTVNIGSTNVSDFGHYNISVDAFDGFTNAFSSITLDIINTGGTWANEAAVRLFNEDHLWAAGHIFVCDAPCTSSTVPALITGFAGGAARTDVPEPATVALLGAGLVLLGAAVRRLKK